MKTDREFLELAAKAAGVELNGASLVPIYMGPEGWVQWNPLTDDGDALRLAVNLGISIDPRGDAVCAIAGEGKHVVIEHGIGAELAVATRRAIVRAAAEIGRGMSPPKTLPAK
jgi:hypothetical protein